MKSKEPDGRWVRDVTGFAIGGVAPVGHTTDLQILIDEDLMQFQEVWAAAGAPMRVFSTNMEQLVKMTGGTLADIKG